MSNNQVVIDTLLAKMQQLAAERDAVLYKYNAEIDELEFAIAKYTGKRPIDAKNTTLYDDENPDYIKSSQEEI